MCISEKYVNVRNYACILKSTEYNSTKSGLQVFLVYVVWIYRLKNLSLSKVI